MLLNKNMFNRFFLVLGIALSINTISNAEICDSIGVERKEGKLFILHRITTGETLYSISKKYNASVDAVKSANPEWAQGLKVGQVLKVPSPILNTAPSSSSLESTTTHTVATGETLYSIATKYAVSVDALKKANPGLTSSISVGQALNIPTKGGSTTTTTQKPTTTTTTTTVTTTNKETIEHKVASGETLYSIARKYGVSVEDIKKANPGLGALKVGQVVKVAGAETVASTSTLATPPATSVPATVATKPATITPPGTKPATPVNVEADTIQLQQDKVRLETMQTKTPPSKPVPATDFKKITESGFADVMADNQDTPKYLAYHKTAPVGTIIQLLNESNGIKVYVRVVGKLTDMGPDNKTIIRVSKKAYDRLGGSGARFAATLMYIP
jgi:LysM repeat protein